MTTVTLSNPLLARDIRLAHQHRHQRVTSQLPMVVEVFVSQCKSIYPLRYQLIYGVFHACRITMIDKTFRQSSRHPDELVHFAHQYAASVAADASTIESTRHRTPSQRVKLQLLTSTLCLQGCFLVIWFKRLITLTLCYEEQVFLTPSVKFPG